MCCGAVLTIELFRYCQFHEKWRIYETGIIIAPQRTQRKEKLKKSGVRIQKEKMGVMSFEVRVTCYEMRVIFS